MTRREALAGAAGLCLANGASAATVPQALATQHKIGRLVIAPGAEGEFDSKGADVPFVFHHDGKFWMTYVGFDGIGYQTGLASSTDLANWRKEGLILRRDASSPVTKYNIALSWIVRENDVFAPGRLKRVNGRFLGVYHAYPKAGYEEGPAVIGLCWSSDLRNWQVDAPCLRAEDGGEWERGGLYKACLVEDGGRYYMLYNAKNPGRRWKEQTGVATSTDLKTWSRFDGNPILANGGAGSPDEIFVSDPCVLRYRDQWAIFYYGLDAKGVARDLLAMSPDLRRTEKCDAALIDVGPKGSVDSQYAHKPSVAANEGKLYHFYCAVSKEYGRGISVASSHPWPSIIGTDKLRSYVETFNRDDEEQVINYVSNAAAYEFLAQNVPLFECPDPEIEKTYYFRWWTYRKSVRKTPDGFVILEFLPDVPWAGKHNTIACPAGHHLYEGRWLRDRRYLDDYSTFWFRRGGDPHRYSFWAADAVYKRYLVTGDKPQTVDLLPDLVRNFEEWERGWKPQTRSEVDGKGRLDPNGLFWQIDGVDGMEISIGGHGYRATINSYMYGDAVAISRIAELAAKPDLRDRFQQRAGEIRAKANAALWDDAAQFYKVLPRDPGAKLADVRELHGLTPWYTHMAEERHAAAWKQIMDRKGFYAGFGPTTAEQRHPRFMFEHKHECLWNGPSWPYATAITLTAMANLLNDYRSAPVTKADYLDLLGVYARSHRRKREDGKVVAWIDENLHPHTGEWIARSILHARNRKDKDRGKDYNHSTFCDLVISGLVGLRPRADDTVEVNPLVPEDKWEYFALDRVPYHGRELAIVYDRTGRKYGRGRGLRIFADGRQIAHSPRLSRLRARLP